MVVAYSGKREKTEGSIDVGKLADMIVVDRDLFKVDPRKIDQTTVVMTIVGGKVVYAGDGTARQTSSSN
jgi:predicted amidohydrolase YtcJ